MAGEVFTGSDIGGFTTSSVGRVEYPPGPASEGRRKGIYHSVIEQEDDLNGLLCEFDLFPFGAEAFDFEPTTRYSERVFVSESVLQKLSPESRSMLLPFLEAIVPLEGSGIPELEDCCILYLGKNDSSRRTPRDVFEQEIDLVNTVFSCNSSPIVHDHPDISFRTLSVTDRVDPIIISQYCDLYCGTFGWTPEQVGQMLTNDNSILMAAFRSEEVISAGIAERAELTIERGGKLIHFVMYEITEAATREADRGNGLYTKVAGKLQAHLAEHTDVNLVYAESNTAAPGVLKAGYNLGRFTSLQALERFDFPPRLLEQHVRISGGTEEARPSGTKNDLLPTFITRKYLQSVYGI